MISLLRVWRRATAPRRPQVAGYLVALGADAAVSGLIALLLHYLPIANVSMLYLVAVLVAAIVFGRGPAIFASVAAVLVFDWFFVDPVFTFTVADPAEWMEFLLFLLVAIITSQLAAEQKHRASEAEAREREAVVLYDVARLLNEPDLDRALQTVAERLLQELSLAALVVEVEVTGGSPISARAEVGDPEALAMLRTTSGRPSLVLGRGSAPSASQPAEPGRWIRVVPPESRGGQGAPPAAPRARLRLVPIRVGDRQVGSLSLVSALEAEEYLPVNNRLLSAVAAQLGSVVDRTRLRQEATEAEILRRSDDQKTALLNAVSHDLRTPLASIIAGSESLLEEDVVWSEEDRREFAQSIRSEALRLNRVVGNLLDLSRISAGSLRPQMGWYDLRALVDDVVGRLRLVTVGRSVEVDVPDDLPPVQLDYVQIDVVLSNLIENAARHTPAGTSITVSARQADRLVRIEVADQGPGIPESSLSRVFDPFYRAQGPGPRPRGTGLGLAIARGLVQAHGGQITAANRAAGGASFVFTLPLATGEPALVDPGGGY